MWVSHSLEQGDIGRILEPLLLLLLHPSTARVSHFYRKRERVKKKESESKPGSNVTDEQEEDYGQGGILEDTYDDSEAVSGSTQGLKNQTDSKCRGDLDGNCFRFFSPMIHKNP